MNIKHIKGDLLKTECPIIMHQVNCQGAMNSGIARQIREAFPEVYTLYKRYCDTHLYTLGATLPVQIDKKHESRIEKVINIFAQDKYGYDGKCYTNYEALKNALSKVKSFRFPQIALPYKMGCCRGGGDWNKVLNIIKKVFEDTDIEILIYEFDRG